MGTRKVTDRELLLKRVDISELIGTLPDYSLLKVAEDSGITYTRLIQILKDEYGPNYRQVIRDRLSKNKIAKYIVETVVKIFYTYEFPIS